MRERMLHAPAWVLAVVSGTIFGLFWVLWMHYGEGDSWTASLVQGGLMGLVFGAIMGPVQHRQQRGVREVADGSPEGLSKRVRRAAFRGPVPAEPTVREAAHGLVLAQLAQLDRQRRWASPFFLLLAALGVFQAVIDNPLWWLAVVLWTAGAVAHPYLRSRLRRRADLLRLDPSAQQVPSP